MISRVLILTFLLTVGADSLAAVTPHVDGEGCAAGCCQAARLNRRGAGPSKLRCLVDCNQSGAANTSPSSVQFIEQRYRKIAADHPSVGIESATKTSLASAFRSERNITNNSTNIYLRTGTLLI